MTEHHDCHIFALLFLLFFLYDLSYIHILGKHPHTGCLIQSGGHSPYSAPGIWACCSSKNMERLFSLFFFPPSCLFIHDLTNNELFLISVIWPLFSFPYMSKLCLPVWVSHPLTDSTWFQLIKKSLIFLYTKFQRDRCMKVGVPPFWHA